MKLHRLCAPIAGLFLFAAAVWADVPPAEQLLPDDTIGFATIPDWTKLVHGYEASTWGRLWSDPSMKPFRDNFSSNFQAEFLRPVEKQLGVKLADYQDLLQGQVTFALTAPKDGAKQFSSFLFLLDSGAKSDQLSAKLKELKKKWTDAGKEVKTEKIRDIEFNSIAVNPDDVKALLKKAFPSPDAEEDATEDKKPAEPLRMRIGQFKSLLIVGDNENVIEKLIARQTGGVTPVISENASYQKSHALLFRDSLGHAWINIKPIYKRLLKFAAAEQQQQQQPDAEAAGPSLKMDKILPALGFGGLETLSANIHANADGSAFQLALGVPEAQREGLFKLFTLEKKDSAPPAFVPADVLKFQRTRIDAQKAWTTIENTLQKIDPSVAGLVQLMLSSAGKDKDPNFDLKKNLVSNLGDDFIQYEKASSSAKPGEAGATLVLIGSPNPQQLLDAMRTLSAMLPPPLSSAPIKEREFLGKKIYSITMGAPPAEEVDADDKGNDAGKTAPAPALAAAQKLSFTTSAGYLAFSSNDSILEEYLRSSENPPKPLRGVAGLAEAAEKIGGMDNGLFSYENQAEQTRLAMQALKDNPDAFNHSLFMNLSNGEEEGAGVFSHLFDLKLLPSFDKIGKYFGITVVSGATTVDGFVIKAFGPTPAAAKK